jgi:hypothetical protein
LPIDEIIRGRKSDFVKTCNSSGFGLISRWIAYTQLIGSD